MTLPTPLLISLCERCHNRFLPREAPCPRCGSSEVVAGEMPGRGVVLASTELEVPAEGWSRPHRLALVDLGESIRVLTLVEGDLPEPGETMQVWRTGDTYWARCSTPETGRGEGDSPSAGPPDVSFEPPR